MDKETLQASWSLVYGVAEMTKEYLFEGNERDKQDMVEAIDDAIKELESWKNEVILKEQNGMD